MPVSFAPLNCTIGSVATGPPISPACDHCYAESWAKRTGSPGLWRGERRRTTASNWLQPVKWNRDAAMVGVRRKVFCAALADVFDNQVPASWRDDLWRLVEQTPHLDWLLLTKRPQNIARMLPGPHTGVRAWGDGWPNVWLGTTAEDRKRAASMLARADEARRLFPALLSGSPGPAPAAPEASVPDDPGHDGTGEADRSRPSWMQRLRLRMQGRRFVAGALGAAEDAHGWPAATDRATARVSPWAARAAKGVPPACP